MGATTNNPVEDRLISVFGRRRNAKNITKSWDMKQMMSLVEMKCIANLSEIIDIIEAFSKLKVFVVGEPIVDTYTFCEMVGVASKSASIAARYIKHEDYAGGSLAIANHLAALGSDVTLLITHGNEEYFQKLLAEKINKNIHVESVITPGFPTPRKTRYLLSFQTQRIFELIDLKEDQWKKLDPTQFKKSMIDLSKNKDLTVVADFGHGMFENSVLKYTSQIESFVALNVQTNSSNMGYNPFTKHSRYDYLSIDERECRMAMFDRFTARDELIQKTFKDIVRRPVSITLGVDGAVYTTQDGREHRYPSYCKEVIDTTGAGDAYFSISSLLVKMGVKPDLVPFLGNCYAGLKARIIGNKQSVSKEDLIDFLENIWKA